MLTSLKCRPCALHAGLEEIASELQESKGKAADEAGKTLSKAQIAGNINRKIISTLAKNVEGNTEALTSVKDSANGEARAMHVAILTLASASASTDEGLQGMPIAYLACPNMP